MTMHLRYNVGRWTADAFRDVFGEELAKPKTTKTACGRRVPMLKACEAIHQIDCRECLSAERIELRDRIEGMLALIDMASDEWTEERREEINAILGRLIPAYEAVYKQIRKHSPWAQQLAQRRRGQDDR